MKTKIILFILCLASLNVMGQGTISRQKRQQQKTQTTHKPTQKPTQQSKPTVKMCDICEQPLSKCDYGGKHPYCQTCGKLKERCEFKGVHPAAPMHDTPVGTQAPQLPQLAHEDAGYDVTFSCNVPSASLYIDGSANGKASGSRFLKVGSHSIKATAEGYIDYRINITVNRKNTSCVITMEKYPEAAKPVVVTTGMLNGHEWVDLGLSVKWATCNVGASTPSDYGGYYAWGETTQKSNYNWDNCFDCINPKKWNKDKSWVTYRFSGQTRITPTSGHDTTRENWGGTWRLPTDEENDELCKKCKWTWTSQNGHKGYVVTGPNGNSIFLPAAGYRYGTNTSLVGEEGDYWSSTLSSSKSNDARYLYFNRSSHGMSSFYRSFGRSVRPVTE